MWPNWRDWYLNRGLAYAAMGRHDEAIADYGKALFFKPDFAEAYVARADAYLQQGRTSEALADYRRALREKPEVAQDYPGIAAKMAMLGARVRLGCPRTLPAVFRRKGEDAGSRRMWAT